MSNQCLITKLKGTVDNDNLLKVGEVRFKAVRTGANSDIVFWFSDRTNHPVDLVSGTIVSQTWANAMLTVTVTPGTIISHPNKYLISGISTNTMALVGDIEQLEFLADSCSSFNFNNVYRYYTAAGEQMSGDLSEIFSKYESLSGVDIRYQNFSGNVDLLADKPSTVIYMEGNPEISGSLVSLLSSTIRQLNMGDTGITGNLSSVHDLSALKELRVPEGVNGSISSLSNLPAFEVFDGSGVYSGDLSSMPATTKEFVSHAGGTFSWDTIRPAASTIFSIGRNNNYLGAGINLGGDLDAFLTNIVNCTMPSIAVKININGTVSASTPTLAAALKTKISSVSGSFLYINGTTI